LLGLMCGLYVVVGDYNYFVLCWGLLCSLAFALGACLSSLKVCVYVH